MVRILIISGSFPPMRCGVGDYTAKLAGAIKSSGEAEVAVLSSIEKPMLAAGIDAIKIRSWKFRVLPEMLGILSTRRPDIVHIQFPTQGYADDWLPWILPLILRIFGFRVVQTWHEFFPMGGHRRSFIPCIACDTAIVVRPGFMQNISSWYRLLLKHKKVVLIPNASAIPESLLAPEERKRMHVELRKGQERVVTYFGFANPNKGVELIFRIADPNRDRIVLLCELTATNPYQREILDLCQSQEWRDKVTVTGFLPSGQVADVLAVSDAVVLPFPGGGGRWNSSLSAAVEQGTLVITTSASSEGYDPDSNTFYCKPGDVESMARALVTHGGRKTMRANGADLEWARIAHEHLRVYGEMIARDRGRSQ